jgi:phage protein U
MNLINQLNNRSIGHKFDRQSFLLHLHKKEFSDTIQVIRNSYIETFGSMWEMNHETYCANVGNEIQLQTQFCKQCGNYVLASSEHSNSSHCDFYKCIN